MRNLKKKSNYFLLIILSYFIISCRTTNEDIIKEGNAEIRIILSNKTSRVKQSEEQSQFSQIPINGGKYSLVGRLTSENTENYSKTGLSANIIPNGSKYRVVVFDSDGNYVTQNVFTQGENGEKIKDLVGGKTYKFIAYTYSNKTPPPAVKESDKINSGLKIAGEEDNDFRYSFSEETVSGDSVNNININMESLYSTVKVIINSEVGNISSISGEVSPNHIEDTVNLADGSITYGDKTNKKNIIFSGLNSSTVTGKPIVINLPVGQTSIFKILSVTIDGKMNSNLEYPFKVDPNQNYTLNLSLREGFSIQDISYTKMFTMALSTIGDIYVAGNNHRYAMGNTTMNGKNITSFKLVPDLYEKGMKFKSILAAGYSTAYAVSTEGRLYVAGYNWLGQLGLGLNNGATQTTFREVLTKGTTGRSLKVSEIWGGEYHTFIKTTDGTIHVAGAHDNLQAGLGYAVPGGQVTTFTKVPPTLFNYETVEKITTGERTTMALTANGNVYYAGRNGASYGSLGGVSDTNMFVKFPTSMPPFNQKIKNIFSGAWHNFVLTQSGELWAAGRNGEGQLGLNSRSNASRWTRVTNVPSQIDDISAGGFHTYLLSSGKLYSTGLNDAGQLGLNDTKSRQVFTPLSIRQPVDAEKLYNGPNNDCRHTYMKGLDGRFYNVGWNAWGQLSNGTTNNNITFQQFYH
ncbi:hypothetical protein [Elizabethkingia ursingii]